MIVFFFVFIKKLVDLAKINKIKIFFLQKFINDKLIRGIDIGHIKGKQNIIYATVFKWTLSNTNSITLSLDKYQIDSAVFSGSTLSIDLLSILNLFHNKASVKLNKTNQIYFKNNLKSNQHTALKSK
ncbi:hypothetical protein BpHYR1_001740 [Brachionus plicatilis]|uniref:Uncharacterized protein n=1 Tax=Brachionus plicatilis TaxID=10195 RepID=A0A3M7QHD6_BRAPC|nr:hypothetical protein BpHYR1_001740 [Brachionus plicatilis]